MRALDLDQLKTLTVVLDTGSLTRAAPLVSLSQSAVSEQMRKLEERVGMPLLSRSKAGVLPTPAGTQLAAYARRLLALSDEAVRDLQGEALRGRLRLAVTDYFLPGDLTRLLARLGAAYPGVRLSVTVSKSDVIEAGYAAGDFDVGLSMRIPGRGSNARNLAPVLRREALQWMSATGLPRERGEPLRLLVLPETCSLHRFTVRLLRDRGVPFSIAHVASGVAGLQSALAAGLGVACLNESSAGVGITRLPAPHGLPALPRVAFHLLGARNGESGFVTRVRELLATELG